MTAFSVRSFLRKEDGLITALNLFLLLAVLMLFGLAVDYGNVVQARTKMQVTADSVAHAALYTRELNSESQAVSKALELAEGNMPAATYGTVVTSDDIQFGTWDAASQTFTFSSGSRQAVLVNTRRLNERTNGVSTFLLGLVGLNAWNVVTPSVFETYYPACFREGLVGDVLVEVQGNNEYEPGFCIHSNGFVSLNSNNVFYPRSVVSMPDQRDISLPSSGFESNPGLTEALRDASYQLRILNRITDIIEGVQNMSSPYMPDYITSDIPIKLNGNTIRQEDLIEGRVHVRSCNGNGQINIESKLLLSKVVLIINCKVKFQSGAVLEDSILISTSSDSRAFNSAAGFQVGRNDHCAEGGGAQLVTLGGMDFPANLQVFGGQLLALGDIEFTANANGIEGAAMVAGGTVSGTSNMRMGFCGGAGMEDNFEAAYFRLAG